MKLYGLYSKKQKCLMGFSYSSNADKELCNDCEVSLNSYYDHDTLWVTPIKEAAETAANTNGETSWYNSDFFKPMWDSKYYGKLEVVCLNDFNEKGTKK